MAARKCELTFHRGGVMLARVGRSWDSRLVHERRPESVDGTGDRAAARSDTVSAFSVPLAARAATRSPAAVLALQRAAGNAATGAALHGDRGGRRLLARSLWGDLGEAASSAWERAGDVAESAAATLATIDPVRATFDFKSARTAVQTAAGGYVGDRTSERRLALVRAVKRVLRGGTPEQLDMVRVDVAAILGAPEAEAVWQEAGTAFGGYTGMYPGYAKDIKTNLEQLGAEETLPFGVFKLQAGGRARHRSDAKRIADDELADLARTDVVIFRGHQFAQYREPGVFSDGSETYGFDLRYIERAGGFGNVKLMISTSCATLCREAFEVFHNLFPNAVILGYRRSAPIQGAKVRKALIRHIKAIGRPLLLEEAYDIWAITRAWKTVIEERHKGDTAQLPGYYDGTTVHYWDGKAWGTVPPTDAANTCKRKRNFSDVYPAPATAAAS